MTYREFLPAIELQQFIYCYWQLKTTRPLAERFIYRVVADGCIDIFFALDNPTENLVMGFCKEYTEFALENTFDYVGIRFLPTMFPQIFKVDAAGLSNRVEELSAVVPQVAKFIADNFNAGLGVQDIQRRLYRAIEIILNNYGVLDVQTDLDTGISPRQLRRLFEFYTGTSPKTFSRVVRFQNILKAKPSKQSLRENKLFFDVGYFDQAHFIKEFKNFYGVTPSKAFNR